MPEPEPTTEEASAAAIEAVRELAWIVPRAPTLTEGQRIHGLGTEVGPLSIDGLQRRVALLQPKVP